MRPLGLVSQIVAVALAVAIAFLFVRPTIVEIGELQTDIQSYQTERLRVSEINQTLANRVADLESISSVDRERITTYMPRALDEVKVLRDLEFITALSDVTLQEIQYDGQFESQSADTTSGRGDDLTPDQYGFTLNVEGTYENIKVFLSLLEQNHYPLQVYAAEMTAVENGLMGLTLTVVTYVDGQSGLDE